MSSRSREGGGGVGLILGLFYISRMYRLFSAESLTSGLERVLSFGRLSLIANKVFLKPCPIFMIKDGGQSILKRKNY